MHRFFVSNENIQNDTIVIIGDDVAHITRVLRLRVNEKIEISNGCGIEYICSISEISKKEVICSILETFKNTTEAPIEITLFQGIPKSQKMDLIVQKCVEIGAVDFYPVITERVIVKLDDKDISSKIDRWNRISEEAAKQSNRGIIPRVHNPITFEKAINFMKDMDLCIIPYENEKNTNIKEIIKDKSNIKKVGIIIGPEGGFEAKEVKTCIDNNILPVTLGPRILRTETAGFVAATIVQYELGDMGGVIYK
jgi:16S rRNA (uracil1498-N3)-methyltransferase